MFAPLRSKSDRKCEPDRCAVATSTDTAVANGGEGGWDGGGGRGGGGKGEAEGGGGVGGGDESEVEGGVGVVDGGAGGGGVGGATDGLIPLPGAVSSTITVRANNALAAKEIRVHFAELSFLSNSTELVRSMLGLRIAMRRWPVGRRCVWLRQGASSGGAKTTRRRHASVATARGGRHASVA